MVSILEGMTLLRDGTVLKLKVFDDKVKELKVGERYTITIHEEGRSLDQNAYMWKLIGEIAKKQDGHRANDMEVYAQIVQKASIKAEYIQVLPEALERLRRAFRVVTEIESRKNEKGVEMVVCKCYYGTSTFTKKEMTSFLEALKDYCTELQIPVDLDLLGGRDDKR